MASLLASVGCAPGVSVGGGVEGDPDGDAQGGATTIVTTNPNPNPPSADPLAGQPRPPPAADLPAFLAGATQFVVQGDTLGAPAGKANRRTYRLDLASNDVFVTYPTLLGGTRLSAPDRAELDALFAQVEEMPMPDTCVYDGPTASITVTREGVAKTYLAEDYNCAHRKDVSYAKSVDAVLAWFDAHIRFQGVTP